MKCPLCGSHKFFIKDRDDEYETYEFEYEDGHVRFDPEADEAGAPEIDETTETYCDKCAWHGKFEGMKKR